MRTGGQHGGDLSTPTLARARLLTVVWLVSSVLSVVLLPLVGVAREDVTLLRVTGVVGVAALFAAQLLVMWSAVTPWASASLHRRAQGVFVAATIASLPMVAPVAVDRWATWAWLGASVVGTAPLLWRWSTTAVVAGAVTATSVVVALVLGGDWTTYAGITLGFGAGLALLNSAPVWLWELLVRADATQQAGARAAAARERNRFGRDVHDVLGHDLTVIALKAELAARTVASDPATSARESEEVRALAQAALGRIRGALAAERHADLAGELAETARVLATAGVRSEVDAQPLPLSPPAVDVLSMVLKEATTNVLRHSDAQWCRIALDADEGRVRLTVHNDRPGPDGSAAGSGLTGLRERLAAVGGELVVRREPDSFLLCATVSVDHG
ncbi:sensor histidine kinase [Nocardioides campestrisoli]|uniref:sensor histidine kinase n=1 Tax=Nocardioides campestrisoli TaxID=2736757 RepID=UPI00163D40EB|nr:histidine kinase [Nocardioides campestrisoli]